jgi:hypothetical protein
METHIKITFSRKHNFQATMFYKIIKIGYEHVRNM